MKLIALLVCTMLVSLRSFSQTVNKSISGQVKDMQNEPVEGAMVRLLKANDSAVLQTTVTKTNGKFTFARLASGVFILNITSLGSKKYISNNLVIDDAHPAILLPVIILTPAKQTELKAVVVTSKKPLIEQDIDKTIVNVEAMISSATSNALEVLEKTPGIAINLNGEIELNGRGGVMVLIEGRQTYMSAQDLAAYLKSIPGSTLDKIELMTNPPAKYDASGSAVINIRFKKNRVQGYTGSLSLSYSQGKLNRHYNSLNLNYLNKKVNLFGNINVNKDRNFDDDNTDRIFYDNSNQISSITNLKSYYRYNSHDFSGRAGMDYTLSSKTIIGFIASVYQRDRNFKGESLNNMYDYNNNIDSSGHGNTYDNARWSQLTANLNLQHKFNTQGREISADINYINYRNNAKQLVDNFIGLNNSGTDSNFTFQYKLPSDINIYTAKADYSHPMKNKLMLSAGVKTSLVKNDSQSDYFDIANNNATPDLSKSNHFIYKENINSLYVNVRKEWKRWSGQLGLRMENTNTTGNQLGNAVVPRSINTNHYTKVFPTVFLNYKLDSLGKHVLSVNFSKRIIRPNYQQLNPFLVFIDQYSYRTGNPYLNPAYNHYIEFSYRYKQFVTISFQYDRMDDMFFNATQPVNTKFINRPENASTRYLAALMFNLNLPVTKWCKVNLNMGTGRFVIKGKVYNQSLDQSLYAYRVNMLSQFTLKKGWSAELSSRYTSRIINLQRVYEKRYQVNAGIQKKIMKGKGSVKLNADDIFWSLKQRDRITGLAFTDVYHINIQDTRRVGIGINFNFGKETFARKRRYNDNGADDVKGRVD